MEDHRRGIVEVRKYKTGCLFRVWNLALRFTNQSAYCSLTVEWIKSKSYRDIGGTTILGTE